MIRLPTRSALTTLNEWGIAHFVLPAIAILLVGAAGTVTLLATHADPLTTTNPYSCPTHPQTGVGNAGTCVKNIQWQLNNFRRAIYKEAPITVDGDFGPNTKAAVVQFQTWNNIAHDGIVGPQTWGEFNDCVASGICNGKVSSWV